MRLAAYNVPRFMHGGLVVGDTWTPVVAADLDAKQRAALRDYHGRYIQVHPEDRNELKSCGLAFTQPWSPLVELDAKKTDAIGAGEDNTKQAGRKADSKTK